MDGMDTFERRLLAALNQYARNGSVGQDGRDSPLASRRRISDVATQDAVRSRAFGPLRKTSGLTRPRVVWLTLLLYSRRARMADVRSAEYRTTRPRDSETVC